MGILEVKEGEKGKGKGKEGKVAEEGEKKPKYETKIEAKHCTTLQAAQELANEYENHLCVLNFASAKNPGGITSSPSLILLYFYCSFYNFLFIFFLSFFSFLTFSFLFRFYGPCLSHIT